MDPIQSLQQRVQQVEQQIGNLQRNPVLPFHIHNGFDMNQVSFADVVQRTMVVPWTLPGATAATAANYSVFYISTFAATITAFREAHTTAGTDAGAVTLQLEKLTSTTAPGSGSTVLGTALSLKATANTVQTGSLTNTHANLNLAVGDRLALKLSGTPTSLASVSVLVALTF